MEAASSSLDVTVADMGTPVVSDQDSCLARVAIAEDDQARGAFEVGAALNPGPRRQGVEFTHEVIYHILFRNLKRTRKAQRLAGWAEARDEYRQISAPVGWPGTSVCELPEVRSGSAGQRARASDMGSGVCAVAENLTPDRHNSRIPASEQAARPR